MRNEEDFWLLNTLRLIDAVNKAAKINKQIEKLKIVNYKILKKQNLPDYVVLHTFVFIIYFGVMCRYI